MTIAVAIRTGSAVIFAADSKVITRGIVGFEDDGSPRWVDQTYDNATKVTYDKTKHLMAMVAGHANVGASSATDFVSMWSLPQVSESDELDGPVKSLVSAMAEEKRSFWKKFESVDSKQWLGPTMIIAATGQGRATPRVWHANLDGEAFTLTEILERPGIWLEGSYVDAFTLLYGYNPDILEETRNLLGIEEQKLTEVLGARKTLSPIHKIALNGMPVQDAVDMAVFLATVQVQMDRFLPGQAACGGPIDVMVLQTAPEPGIRAFPGKVLHHPRSRLETSGEST